MLHPSLLLLFFPLGPYVVFAGATWNLRPTVQVLSTPLSMHFHSTDVGNWNVAARHMAAFWKAVGKLKKYYDRAPFSLTSPPTPSSAIPHIFPYPTSFQLLGGGTAEFEYQKQLDDHKLIFHGALKDSKEQICIKFVLRYSREVHEYCAKEKYAPALRGLDVIPGGWSMVVMDVLTDYTTLYQLPKSRKPSRRSFTKLENFLERLHKAGFVHGDIRDTNIMVSPDGKNFKLVDFDWAGKAGVTYYPPDVNIESVTRPKDVRSLGLILDRHDMEMLKNITDDV